MKNGILLLLLLGMIGSTDAQLYQIKITLNPSDYMGVCDNAALNRLEFTAFGQCLGNFLNPGLPSLLRLLDPLQGENLQAKFTAIDIFSMPEFSLTGILEKLLNIPLVLFGTVLEILANGINILLVFGFKFAWTYLFYISLGFQSILRFADNDARSLTSAEKIYSSLFLIGVATILTLSYGGGFIQ